MSMVRVARRSPIVTLLIALLLAALALVVRQQVAYGASSLPADKMTVTASRTAVQGPNTDAVLMTAQMKTSTPADLLLQVTAECTILSSITNTGSETQAYNAKVELWIELDGKPVPVVPGATASGATSGTSGTDDGRVVFCNREFQRTTMYDTNNESIKDVENTSEANAFNWVALNVGNGVHTIVVKAHFTDTNGADTFAHGVISDRSMTADTTNYFISQPSA
ncbi:MAG TPA: hypothetical protein VFJ98_05355 [Mycobacteriales bacterium]|nr:hypothetical protein [Mycobacteriales bacterium]